MTSFDNAVNVEEIITERVETVVTISSEKKRLSILLKKLIGKWSFAGIEVSNISVEVSSPLYLDLSYRLLPIYWKI